MRHILHKVNATSAPSSISTSVHTSDLEFWTDPQSSTGCLGLANTLNDTLCISLKVKGPLVEGAVAVSQ